MIVQAMESSQESVVIHKIVMEDSSVSMYGSKRALQILAMGQLAEAIDLF